MRLLLVRAGGSVAPGRGRSLSDRRARAAISLTEMRLLVVVQLGSHGANREGLRNRQKQEWRVSPLDCAGSSQCADETLLLEECGRDPAPASLSRRADRGETTTTDAVVPEFQAPTLRGAPLIRVQGARQGAVQQRPARH